MTDLFDWKSPARYPDSPGFKESTTSKDAAHKVAGQAMTLREQVLKVLQVKGPDGMTADEIAHVVGRSEFSIRPRVSELRKQKLVHEKTTKGSVERRDNESGMSAIVWVAVSPN
jgi:hypothetical protein